jgi:hypothetical protein
MHAVQIVYTCGAVQTVALEPAPGVKNNVSRSLAALAADAPSMSAHEMQLQVQLSWLHALLQVRPHKCGGSTAARC